jgi:cyclophilin family peptidyl-prolyl cis-trans isomerase
MRTSFDLWSRLLSQPVTRRRRSALRQALETLEVRRVLAATISQVPSSQTFTVGSPTYIGVQGQSSTSSPITYTATSSSADIVVETVTTGRSIRLNVSGKDGTNADFTGDIVLRLFEDKAPVTTARIIQLAQSGFYNGLLFHRVVPNFVAQGGDPSGNGSGGSGTKFSDEYDLGLTFNGPGLLAMANSGDDTNDSQFFITAIDQPLPAQRPQHLNFQHSIFGVITSGHDTFRKLMATQTSGNPNNRPLSNATINTAPVFTDTTNGVIRVTGPADRPGSGTVTIKANDGGGADATTTLTVGSSIPSRNNPAFLGAVSDISTNQSTPVTFTVTGFDSELEALSFELFATSAKNNSSAVGPAPANFTYVKEATTVGGRPAMKFTITPNAGFTGNVDFLVGARDSQSFFGDGLPVDALSHFDTEEIRLVVSGAAVTQAIDDTLAVAKNGAVQTYDVRANDVVAAGAGSLTVISVTSAGKGTTAVAAGGAGITYVPSANATGTDTFTYTIRDGSNTQRTATVSVQIGGTTVLRGFNPTTKAHFFTTSSSELANAVAGGYRDESSSATFRVFTAQLPGMSPVVRVFNKQANLHYLTLSTGERDFLTGLVSSSDATRGWREESTGMFMFPTQFPGTVEILHLYDTATGSHLYTDNAAVRNQLLGLANTTWQQHRSLGFAFQPEAPVSAPATAAAVPLIASANSNASGDDAISRLIGLATRSSIVAPAVPVESAPVIITETPSDPISGGRPVSDEGEIVIGTEESDPEGEEAAAMEKAMDELYASRELPVD